MENKYSGTEKNLADHNQKEQPTPSETKTRATPYLSPLMEKLCGKLNINTLIRVVAEQPAESIAKLPMQNLAADRLWNSDQPLTIRLDALKKLLKIDEFQNSKITWSEICRHY